ncbi:MAG: tetratricopeptide repeat protein [Bacteriovoracales bacterium]|nr:tetratricopeptide repeat protein [Bacteriovoracales bacterium]
MGIKSLILALTFSLSLLSCGHLRGPSSPSVTASEKSSSSSSPSPSREIYRSKVKEELEKMVTMAKKRGKNATGFIQKALFLKASQASLAQDYESAALIYEYVARLSPSDPYLALKYATSLLQSGRVSKARFLLEKHYPKSGPYRERFGLLLAGLYSTKPAQKAKAEAIYRNILKENPKSIEACLLLSDLELGTKKKKEPKAFDTIKKCEKFYSDKGIFSYYRGKAYLQFNDIEAAKKSFAKSLTLEPTFYQSAVALGLILENQKKRDKAVKVYKDFLEHWPTNHPILSRLVKLLFARPLKNHGDYADAIEYTQRLVYLDPTNLNLKAKLGVLYSERGNYDKSIAILEEVIREVPESDKLLYYLAAIYQVVEKYERSIDFFSRIPKESEFYVEGSLQITQILSTMALEDYRRSMNLAEEVLKTHPENANLLNFVGYSHLEREDDMDKAFRYISKAIRLAPEDGYIRDSLGWYYYKVGKWELALKELERAYKLVGNDSTITKHLALVYQAMNRYDLAKSLYRKALALTKDREEKDEINQFIDEIETKAASRYPASKSAP